MAEGIETGGHGTWWHPSEPNMHVAGRFTTGLAGPSLELLDPPPLLWVGQNIPSGQAIPLGTSVVPMLHGYVADIGPVTLLDSRWAGLSVGRTSGQRLIAAASVAGVHLTARDQPFLRRIEVVFPTLADLLGRGVGLTSKGFRMPSGSGKFSMQIDQQRQTWRSADVEVIWEYEPTGSIGPQSGSITVVPRAVMASRNSRSLFEWLDSWVVPMNTVIQILAGRRSNPESITGWKVKNMSIARRSTEELHISMRGVGKREVTNRGQVLLSARQINTNPGGLPAVLQRAQVLSQQHGGFLELLMGSMNLPDRPLRNRYLDLTSALEAYHSRSVGIGPIDDQKFDTERKALLADAKAALTSAQAKFLRAWLPRRSTYSLENRLQYLAKMVGVGGWTISAQRMGQLRNDVAHGNPGIQMDELDTAYQQAFDLARRVVGHELVMAP